MGTASIVNYMLDANILIMLLDRNPMVDRRASECFEGDLCVSAIAYAEVARGPAAEKEPALLLLEQAIKVIPVMPFDAAAARRYADLPFARHRFDRLIAAHALSLDLTLVSANRKDFADITGLKVEDWTT